MLDQKSEIASFKLESCTTLPEFFTNSVRLYPNLEALRQFNKSSKTWESLTYQQLNEVISQWRKAFASLDLPKGTRVGILMPNGIEHVCADQAALANGLVPVPLHAIDTPGASAFILSDSQAKVLVTNNINRWLKIAQANSELPHLTHVIVTEAFDASQLNNDKIVLSLNEWLATSNTQTLPMAEPQETDLASIVYTSGTTGRPKGVLLTHKNIVSNVKDTLKCVSPKTGDIFLSFLPLSHTFERTAGYYLALATGCTIAYNRSILLLADDLKKIRPDVIISVPRVYERIFARVKENLKKASKFNRYLFNHAVEAGWREFCRKNKLPVEPSQNAFLDFLLKPLYQKVAAHLLAQFGGRLRIAISGGASLNREIAKTFCGLGLPIIQGYGMTEASPIISGNSLAFNQPNTVGLPFENVQVRLSNEGEIQIKGPSITKGYWNRPEDTQSAFTSDGWFKTGDIGEFTTDGLLQIKGRIKEIIVTSTGEKVPPADLEVAIETDELFSQCYIVGENRPYLSLITVLSQTGWEELAQQCNLDPSDLTNLNAPSAKSLALKRAKEAAKNFPNYALPRAIVLTTAPWTIEDGLITPTLKLKRKPLSQKFEKEIAQLYATHG